MNHLMSINISYKNIYDIKKIYEIYDIIKIYDI